jgi:hypothetical protein
MQMERDTIAYVHINSSVPSLRGQKQLGKLSSEVSGCNMTNVLYGRHWTIIPHRFIFLENKN